MKRKAFAALVVAGTIILSPAPVLAADPGIEEIGLFLVRIGDFDPGTGLFEAEFYLQIRCDNPCEPNPEIVNGHPTFEHLYAGGTERYQAWRFRAELQQDVDLRRYPFQQGTLPIEIEDQLDDLTKMVYEVDESSGVDEGVALTNHRLESGWAGRVEPHPYPFFDQTYSRFIFSVDYSSPIGSVLLKDILPAALITIYGFLAFLIDPRAESSRYTISGSALVALVFYGVNFISRIPHTDYLTFADKYIVINISVLVMVLGSIMFVSRQIHAERPERARSLNPRIGIALVVLWLALLGIAAFQL